MLEKDSFIGIFVGAGESLELAEMADKRRGDGFVVGGDVMDDKIQSILKKVSGKVVVIEGSKLNACVKRAVKDALDNGARKVIIDLEKTRVDETDSCSTSYSTQYTLDERAHSFSIITAWSGFNMNRKKIEVLPKNVWERELSNL